MSLSSEDQQLTVEHGNFNTLGQLIDDMDPWSIDERADSPALNNVSREKNRLVNRRPKTISLILHAMAYPYIKA